jgi:RNA polymerase sigma-70 factor (ECF subfamily)
MDKTDQELIEQYKGGERIAIEILVDRHLKAVYNFCVRMVGNEADAEDVTQESFLKAWKNISKYNAEFSFKTWILSIARNTSIDFLRKKKSINFSELDSYSEDDRKFEDSLRDSELLPDEVFERKELAKEAQDALDAVPLRMREVVLLHLAEGLTFEEIARILKEPMNTVKSRYRRALEALRGLLSRVDAPK